MKPDNIFIVPFFLLFLTFSVGAQDVNESLEHFTELKVFNGLEVEVVPSKENRIEITGHSKNEVKFNIVDNRLEVRLKLSNLWSQDNTRIRIYGKSLEVIDANQASVVEVTGLLEGEVLTFRAQEGANIIARVNSLKISSKVVTKGKIKLEGKTEEQTVEINTGGHYYGKDLRTQHTEISTGTAGRGEVNATEYVKASASLGGTVEIFGRPKEVDTKTSLGGRIF
ncbi:head GIN domain-containing protein [Salinimicrobium xinjiangense]|uniref:head GIN domain-containing protein n=1 Tax=Salinimicrobium xinjiangense TaxID=438596 RepID=UPI000421E008|nr:head GIN domain-containing protein [Salinimicrobium xinjiangense]